mmetsp:Transcript_16169/g.46157  ORF Transcript_16169/g.46157 Transcript_16169/m.46157 type:complete len:225 (+) Transcript_16169:224-898(+)
MSFRIPAVLADLSRHTDSFQTSSSLPFSQRRSPSLLSSPAIMKLQGYTPILRLRRPPRVTPRCRRDVAPSLWDCSLCAPPPHHTWASMTPKCPCDMKLSTSRSTSLLPRLAHDSSPASLRCRCSSCRHRTSAFQQLWLIVRNASAKAMQRSGARRMVPGTPWRGTKSSSSPARAGRVCQSAFQSSSFSSFTKPHLSTLAAAPPGDPSAHARTPPANGPSGSPWR